VPIAMTALHSIRLEHVCKISCAVPTVLAVPLTLESALSVSLATF